jgi:hypothetical protein
MRWEFATPLYQLVQATNGSIFDRTLVNPDTKTLGRAWASPIPSRRKPWSVADMGSAIPSSTGRAAGKRESTPGSHLWDHRSGVLCVRDTETATAGSLLRERAIVELSDAVGVGGISQMRDGTRGGRAHTVQQRFIPR